MFRKMGIDMTAVKVTDAFAQLSTFSGIRQILF